MGLLSKSAHLLSMPMYSVPILPTDLPTGPYLCFYVLQAPTQDADERAMWPNGRPSGSGETRHGQHGPRYQVFLNSL